MEKRILKSLLAGATVLALLLACMLAGLSLPASAETTVPNDAVYTGLKADMREWWLMTGRSRDLNTAKDTTDSVRPTFTLTYTYNTTDTSTVKVYAEDLDWKINDQQYATLQEGTAIITGVSVGEAVLTATLPSAFETNGATVSCDIPVHVIDGSNYEYFDASLPVDIEQLLIDYDELLLPEGDTHTLKLQTFPYGGDLTEVEWTTGDASVATVTAGKVTAVNVGTTTITATLAGVEEVSCSVTVVRVGKELLANNTFGDSTDRSWKSLHGVVANYVAGQGKNGKQALCVDRNYPVYQSFAGLEPNTTYTIQGGAKLSADKSCLVITVKNGDTVVARLEEQYAASSWDELKNDDGTTVPSQLYGGYTFTTPATLESDITEIHIAVKKNAQDTADTLATKGIATFAVRTSIEKGEGTVTDNDNDEDLSDSRVYCAYLDEISLGKQFKANVDLTPTDVQWDGDDDNDGQVTPGTRITFKVPVKNVGTEDLLPGQRFTVDIAAGGKVIRTFSYDGGIKVGETVLVTDTEAWEAEAGDHMISARVNADKTLYETNLKTNQTYQLNLRVAEDSYKPAHNTDLIAQAGMDKLTLSDDFDDLSTIDTLAGGAEGYKWYVTRPWDGGYTLKPYEYETENGVLTLMGEKPTYNICLTSTDINTGNGYRYNKGYTEVRLRIVRPSSSGVGDSGSPAVWAFTQNKALEGIYGKAQHWVELDWMEYWGITNDFSNYPNGYYTTSFHHSVAKGTTDPSYTNSNRGLNGLGDAEWHVMGWLWENNSFRTFLDGVEVQRMLIDPEASCIPNPSPKNDYGKKDDAGAYALANVEKAVLYLSGSKDSPLEIDYVRVWQQSDTEDVSDAMTLDRAEVTMDEDTLEQLTVSVPDGEEVGTLTWKSSDPSVVTVHGNGQLYARNAGKAVVTATNANGISVMCTVTVKHNLISGGDFELKMDGDNNEDILFEHWKNTTNSSYRFLTEEPGNAGNHCLAMCKGAKAWYYLKLSVKGNTTYRLCGRAKREVGRDTVTIHFPSKHSNGGVQSIKSGNNSTDWEEFSVEFTTTDSPDKNYVLGFRHNTGTYNGTVYLDDLVLTEVDNVRKAEYTATVSSAENGTVTLRYADTDVAIENGTPIAPGTKLEVVAKPSNGYQLQLGSLGYAYTQATLNGAKAETRRILNKNNYDHGSEWFGAGDGTVYYFEMPENDITLSAVFESKSSEEQMPVATLGTSVYINEETNAISGVRFLSRLYYTRMEGNDLYVMYGGSEVKVKRFGTLLKREASELELTLESYEQNKDGSGNSRIWMTSAYNGGNIGAVDYTSTYIDFASVMTSPVANRYAFLNRGYAVCAYLVLEDDTEIYTDIFTDSVLDAQARS